MKELERILDWQYLTDLKIDLTTARKLVFMRERYLSGGYDIKPTW